MGFQNAIWKTWKDANETHGSHETTANMYAAWIAILDQCLNAIPLGSGPYHNQKREEIIRTLNNIEEPRARNEEKLREYENALYNAELLNALKEDTGTSITHKVVVDKSPNHRKRKSNKD